MKLNLELFKKQSRFRGMKCNEILCLNSYVKLACFALERDHDVIRFHYRTASYQFFNPKTEKTGTNFIDFDVEYKHGRKLIQCIPDDLLANDVMISRIDAMELAAIDLQIPFEIWGEEVLFGTNPEYRDSLIRFFT